MKRSLKDIDITMVACLKSVIEAGIPPSEWEQRTKEAFNIHNKLTTQVWKNLNKETKTNGK